MILGLDASTKSTGYGIFHEETKRLIASGCITADGADMMGRINKIVKNIKERILEKYQINELILEEVIPKNGYMNKNIKTYKALMYLQAKIMFLLHDEYPYIKVIFKYPGEWRKEVGIHSGPVKREEMKKRDITYVKNVFGLDVNDDEADGICLAYSALQQKGAF